MTTQERAVGGIVGGVQVQPWTYLLIHLASRFAPLGEEQRLMAQNELMHFDRLPNESIDALIITRCMAIRSRAQTGGRMAMTWVTFIVASLPCQPSADGQPIQSIWRYSTYHGPAIQSNGNGSMPHGTHPGGYNLQSRTTVTPAYATNIFDPTKYAAKCTAARSIWRPRSMGITIVKLIVGTSTTVSAYRSLGKLWSDLRHTTNLRTTANISVLHRRRTK